MMAALTLEKHEGRRAPFQRKQHRWRIRAANGRIIANGGEGYANLADLEAALDLVRQALTS